MTEMFDTRDDVRDVRVGDIPANSPMGLVILLQSEKRSDRIYALNHLLKGGQTKRAERKIPQGVETIAIDAMFDERESAIDERNMAHCQFDIFRRGLR